MLVALASMTSLLAGCGVESGPRGGVQIVLITLDSLRYDSFTGVDGEPSTMPRLEAWAEKAAVFERHFAASPVTQPSHASMLTGLHPWGHGVSRNGLVLDPGHVTLAEKLRAHRFKTAAAVSSLPVSGRFGFGQGFDHFDDEFEESDVGLWEWQKQEVDAEEEYLFTLAESTTGRATRLLDSVKGDRRFFWFHYFDPHDPYGDTAGDHVAFAKDPLRVAVSGLDPTEALETTRGLYDLDVFNMDRHLGTLLDRLERDSETIETHVLIVSDHGESFGEHNSVSHGQRLIPSQVHVPLLVRSPRIEPGARADISGSIDVYSTLLSMAGLSPGTPSRGASRDLLAPPPSRGWAFGLRQTFVEPFLDQRLDGNDHLIHGLLFYAVDDGGRIIRGNSAEVLRPPGSLEPMSPELEGQLKLVFSGFESDLTKNAAQALGDSDTRRALEALGYIG